MREEEREEDLSNMSSDFARDKAGRKKTLLNFSNVFSCSFLSLCRHLEQWPVSSKAWFGLAELDRRSFEDESVGG